MSRPAFQFYPKDWRTDANLRRCSHAARGAWMDVLCLLHDSDEYGVVRWPLAELAQAAGAPLKLLKELADKNVLRGGDKHHEAFVWTPRHAGMDGDPVTLLAATVGPCWYSRRLVKDEYVRQRRGAGTRFAPKSSPNNGDEVKPKCTPKSSPKHTFGDDFGGGASSSSSSSEIGRGKASTDGTERARPPDSALEPEAGSAACSDDQAKAVVQACIVLRKLGMQVQSAMPPLITVVAAGATVEQLALTASELALRKSGLLNDPDVHPELLELFASGATAAQMNLTPEQYTLLRNSAPNIGYLASTLLGRARDAAQEGESHDVRKGGYAGSRGGARRQESAADRAERKQRAGDAREAAITGGDDNAGW